MMKQRMQGFKSHTHSIEIAPINCLLRADTIIWQEFVLVGFVVVDRKAHGHSTSSAEKIFTVTGRHCVSQSTKNREIDGRESTLKMGTGSEKEEKRKKEINTR